MRSPSEALFSILFLILCFAVMSEGCLKYGHSCLGGHGKRSDQPEMRKAGLTRGNDRLMQRLLAEVGPSKTFADDKNEFNVIKAWINLLGKEDRSQDQDEQISDDDQWLQFLDRKRRSPKTNNV
ncbi:Uncharacterised protein g7766 [Pycnogonum litorale]